MNHSWDVEAIEEQMARDAVRLDWLQKVKNVTITASNVNTDIAAVGLFSIPSQHVYGNTVRDAIDEAMRVAKERQQ